LSPNSREVLMISFVSRYIPAWRGPLRVALMAGALGGLSGCSSDYDSVWYRDVLLSIVLGERASQKRRREESVSPVPVPPVKDPPDSNEVPPSVMVKGRIGRMRGRILAYPQIHLPGTDPLAPTPVIARFQRWNGVGRDDIFDMLYTRRDNLKTDPDFANGINPDWLQKLSSREIQYLIYAATDGLRDINEPRRQTLSAHILLDLNTNDRLLSILRIPIWNTLQAALMISETSTRLTTFNALMQVASRSRHLPLVNFYNQIQKAYLEGTDDVLRQAASTARTFLEADAEAFALVFQLRGTREEILTVAEKIEALLPALSAEKQKILKRMLERKMAFEKNPIVKEFIRRLFEKINFS